MTDWKLKRARGKSLTRDEAIEAIRGGARVEYVHRDATLAFWLYEKVWIDADGDLVWLHPTDDGTLAAPEGRYYRVLSPEEQRRLEEREARVAEELWGD